MISDSFQDFAPYTLTPADHLSLKEPLFAHVVGRLTDFAAEKSPSCAGGKGQTVKPSSLVGRIAPTFPGSKRSSRSSHPQLFGDLVRNVGFMGFHDPIPATVFKSHLISGFPTFSTIFMCIYIYI